MSATVGFMTFVWASRYTALFIGCFVEGTLVMVSGGLFARFGVVDFWTTYVIFVAADSAADLSWYFLGFLGARPLIQSIGSYIGISSEALDRSERRFKNHQTSILVVSKLTMGFGLSIATLLTAGALRISLLRYITINFLCGLVWVLFLMTVGYYYGAFLYTLPPSLWFWISAGVLLVGLVVFREATRRMAIIEW